jgi:hypothetical protein
MGAVVNYKKIISIAIAALILFSAFPHPVFAAVGLPNSASFGYGARLDMWGEDVYAALDLAANMGLDWLAIDVDWARHWPAIDQPADFSKLDYVLQAARQKQISILLSLTHAPAWALTATGPEPSFTNALLQSILAVYSDVIQAVELFPGANSSARWGAAPNPQAYLTMLQTVRQGCDAAGRTVYLVTTVEPILPGTENGSLDDQVFLESLYMLGGKGYLPIIGIRFPMLMGAPMSDQSDLYPIVLRHYEGLRALMLQHEHAHGMIWITGFSWPTSGTADPMDPLTLPVTPAHQAQWVNQAFQLLRAQLFIGTAFFAYLNHEISPEPTQTLAQSGGTIHPASVAISQFTGGSVNTTAWATEQNNSGASPGPVNNAVQTGVNNFLHYEGKPRK